MRGVEYLASSTPDPVEGWADDTAGIICARTMQHFIFAAPFALSHCRDCNLSTDAKHFGD